MSKIAFSYLRFSSKKQEEGDSLRRQTDLARRYAAEHGLVLSEQSFLDLGVSAYKGANANAEQGGGLGLFIRAVEEGAVPADCYLLVESLDRISRNDVDLAIELLMRICRLGVTVVSLNDNQVYSSERIKQDRGISLIISITSFIRANEESQIKSARIGAAWQTKRNNGGILTKICPGWLRVADDYSHYEIVEDEAAKVNKIFNLCLDGHGSVVISNMLNSAGIKTATGKPYTPALVVWQLKNPAVIGTYTPSKAKGAVPIENQYPAIIDKVTFNRAQEMLATRARGRRTTDGQIRNLFAGSMFCGSCGSVVKSTSASDSAQRYYLVCKNAYSHLGCGAKNYSYYQIEDSILEHVFSRQPNTTVVRSKTPIIDHKAELASLQQAMDNLINMVMQGINNPQIQQKIQDLTNRIEDTKKQIAKSPVVSPLDQVYARAYELRIKVFNLTKDLKTMPDDLKESATNKLNSYRLRLRAELKRLVQAVYIAPHDYTDGHNVFRRAWLYSDLSDTNPTIVDSQGVPQGIQGSRTAKRITDGAVKLLADSPEIVNFVRPNP